MSSSETYHIRFEGERMDILIAVSVQEDFEIIEAVKAKIRSKIEHQKTIDWLKKPIVLFNASTHYLKNGKPTKRPKLRI